MGNYKKALVIPVFLFCLSVSTAFAGKELSATDWFEKGVAFQISGKYNEAIDAYNRAIELNPEDASVYYNRGSAYGNSGNYQQAINDYNKAIEIYPEYDMAYHNRGYTYHLKGDYDRAIADYTEAIRLDPKIAGYYFSRGYTYYFKGDYDRAIADYTKAIELDPKLDLAYYNRGNAYRKNGDYKKAAESIDKAVKLDPEDLENRWYQGEIYLLLGDVNTASKAFEKAFELALKRVEKENSSDNYSNAAWISLLNGDVEGAEKYAKEGVRITPNSKYIHANVGAVYLIQGNKAKAMDEYKKYLNQSPDKRSELIDAIKDGFTLLKKRYPDKASLIEWVEKELGIGK